MDGPFGFRVTSFKRAISRIFKICFLIECALLQEMTVEGQRWVWDVAFSADSQYMFTASSDGVARLWSIPAKPEVKRTYKENGHTKAVTCLAFRDGTSMVK